jgi:ATP-binding protein involved in chromosome partitioning
VPYPGFQRDVVSFGTVKDVRVEGGDVRIRLDVGAGNPAALEPLRRDIQSAVESLEGVTSVQFDVRSATRPSGLRMVGSPPPQAPSTGILEPGLLPGVRHTVAVASGKGGVGKSTVAVNLAVALARDGARVGLMDSDIYGPSIPLMMGVDEQPRLDSEGQKIVPFERYGVRFMSLGFLVDRRSAVIWRGPMVMKAVDQLLRDVAWGDLDFLVVDMPPGTGDAQLTLAQKVTLAGAVIVTTPQDVALADAVKGVAMFRKLGVPILGIVENMSYFACPHCSKRTDVFGHGGGRAEATTLEVPFLGEVPLHPSIRDGGDTGHPIVAAAPDSAEGAPFAEISRQVRRALPIEQTAADGPSDRHRGGRER